MADHDSIDPDLNFTGNYTLYNDHYIDVNNIDHFLQTPTTYGLNVTHINCCSLSKNFGALKNLLNSVATKLPTIALSETWLTKTNESIFQLPGYSFVLQSREKKIGGGVAIYIDNTYTFHLRNDLIISSDVLESIFVEVERAKAANIIIGCIYRHPNTYVMDFNSQLTKLLDKINQNPNKPSILTGDFNLNLIKADTHPQTNDFLSIMTAHSFIPTITKPTRITSTTATLIDNVFINCITAKYARCILCSDISDHLPIMVKINLIAPKKFKCPKKAPYERYLPETINTFKMDLGNANWNLNTHHLNIPVGTTNFNPGDCYTRFLETFSHIFNAHFPLTETKHKKNLKHNTEWITSGLMNPCVKKLNLYKQTVKNPLDLALKEQYKTYRNKLNIVL